MTEDAVAPLLDALHRVSLTGDRITFWLRDDDAVEPTPALDRLLATMEGLPLTLAVIPQPTGAPLARRLSDLAGVSVAVHGWSHRNHAAPGEKSQELGAHRPLPQVREELVRGLARLSDLYPQQVVPLLVPPWNRIAPEVAADLADRGYRALSVFGPDKPSPLPLCNTHLDLIDWRGTRGGRPAAELWSDLAAQIDGGRRTIGILSHHLVHDDAAWAFLEQLVALTSRDAACRWEPVTRIGGLAV